MENLRKIQIKKHNLPSRYTGLKVLVFILLLLAFWVWLMNYLSNKLHPINETVTHNVQAGLYYELALDKLAYGIGEPIHLMLILRNISGKPISLSFATTERYEFAVRRDWDFIFFDLQTDVWKSSYGQTYENKSESFVIKPRDEKVFEEVWNQKDAKGKQVGPGRFIISATLTNIGGNNLLTLPTRTRR